VFPFSFRLFLCRTPPCVWGLSSLFFTLIGIHFYSLCVCRRFRTFPPACLPLVSLVSHSLTLRTSPRCIYFTCLRSWHQKLDAGFSSPLFPVFHPHPVCSSPLPDFFRIGRPFPRCLPGTRKLLIFFLPRGVVFLSFESPFNLFRPPSTDSFRSLPPRLKKNIPFFPSLLPPAPLLFVLRPSPSRIYSFSAL